MQRNVLNFKVKKTGKKQEGADVFDAVASTIDIDRDGEIVVPYGVDETFFLKNPLLLGFHERRSWPIGKVLNLDITENELGFEFIFADTQEGLKAKYLYEEGFMNSFSIGFAIKEYIDGPWEKDELVIEYKRGKIKIPVKKYKDKLWGIISKWELREISAVTVPANPYANLRKSLLYKALDMPRSQLPILKAQIDEFIKEIDSSMETVLIADPVVAINTGLKLDNDTKWNLDTARAQLAMFASSDGTGQKDTIVWHDYAKGFTLIDLEKADKFSGYDFAHHHIKDNKMVLSEPGLRKAMASVLALENNENKKGAYDHLAAHYKEFDIDIPEYKSYTEEQLKLIAKGESLKSDTDSVTDSINEMARVSNDDKLDSVIEKLQTFSDTTSKSIMNLSENLLSIQIKMAIIEDKMTKDPQTRIKYKNAVQASELVQENIDKDDKQVALNMVCNEVLSLLKLDENVTPTQ